MVVQHYYQSMSNENIGGLSTVFSECCPQYFQSVVHSIFGVCLMKISEIVHNIFGVLSIVFSECV